MVFTKALCVVLLLFATIFGENQRLENHFNLEKRAPKLPKGRYETVVRDTARDLIDRARYITGDNGQLGFIYIQRADTSRSYLTPEVEGTLKGRRNSRQDLANGQLYPPRPRRGDNTNFRMNFRARRPGPDIPREHTEHRLLTNNGLKSMVEYTKSITKRKECPKYVIFHSNLLPCMRNKETSPRRCLDMIGKERYKLRHYCRGTEFYLHTIQDGPRQNQRPEESQKYYDRFIMYIKDRQIFWVNSR
ncbi:Hypothetical predicted protein [Paramuricea clavata]|uniref:Uncharacterized protein n=1 Tax=Paramuricea clavata TaxID=317549 RepID=A0A7D9IRC6_PARCT|nr:Hypothetical predicted protein [Paramuricea clavata]